jgi:hypothetical protein
VTVDVYLAETTVAALSSTFASNYSSPPQLLARNLQINLPDLSLQPRQSPAPFNVTIPHGAFAYTGTDSLIFEIVVQTSSAGASFYGLDAATGSNLIAYGPYQLNGIGCTVNGKEMTLRSRVQNNFIPTGWNTSFVWELVNAPAVASSLLLIGFTNPSLPIPGLCSPPNSLYTQPLVILSGVTSNTGAWSPNLPALPRHDPLLVGAPIETQALAIDMAQPGIPAVVSNGLTSAIAPTPGVFNLARVYATGNPNATTGTVNPSLANVVRFN